MCLLGHCSESAVAPCHLSISARFDTFAIVYNTPGFSIIDYHDSGCMLHLYNEVTTEPNQHWL